MKEQYGITGLTGLVRRAALLCLTLGICGVSFAAAGGRSCFKVFDATLYSGKPDLSVYGIQHLKLVEPARWWKQANAGPAQRREVVMKQAKDLAAGTDPVVVDLELPLAATAAGSGENIQLYIDVIKWMRDGGYQKPLSFYGSLPIRDYWRAQKGPANPGYRDWQLDNNRLNGIVDQVDALYPSLYTFYDNEEGWTKYAAENIAEARRIAGGRPVYVFLWPQYHDSARGLAYQFLPPDFWMKEMQVAGRLADGFVIWGGRDFVNKQPMQWDDQAPWWRETMAFMKSRKDICTVD